MSEKKKWKRAVAALVAKEIAGYMEHDCVRLTVAGSLRRGKEEVGDVELLYASRIIPDSDLFGTISGGMDLSESRVGWMVSRGVLGYRFNKDGHHTWGVNNKLAVHLRTGVPVDLFKVEPEDWWTALVIRTGSKETNLRLTTGARACGRRLSVTSGFYGVYDADGLLVRPSSEEEVFEWCGVPYLAPEAR